MMQKNIDNLFVKGEEPNAELVQEDDDIAKAQLHFISLYILAEESKDKLYFAHIAAESGKWYSLTQSQV